MIIIIFKYFLFGVKIDKRFLIVNLLLLYSNKKKRGYEMNQKKKGLESVVWEMTKGFAKDVATAGKGVAYLLTAPVIGNLSSDLKNRIYGTLTNDADMASYIATGISMIANTFAYTYLADSITNGYGPVGFVCGWFEAFGRGIESSNKEKKYAASLMGLVPSAIMQYVVNLYDDAKTNLENKNDERGEK
ncbi:hypothetical protein C4573_06590 [Candidatus Woesearchaeota archaeon]|nr:MAG: hypothetical protein C4573_06590 [Candidatus Woesearchaeota archaeon]